MMLIKAIMATAMMAVGGVAGVVTHIMAAHL